ncbi:uncharacterized protein LOC143277846 isoform X2 [Babylonia areolata]|uniref:uncharacterized protein LOC143277846 isoform X2 n=1 Tax=Babylonia areolata TaxID=304850 RepID=UPI003FD54214
MEAADTRQVKDSGAVETRSAEDDEVCCLPIKFEIPSETEEVVSGNCLLTGCVTSVSNQTCTASQQHGGAVCGTATGRRSQVTLQRSQVSLQRSQVTPQVWHLDVTDTAYRRWRQLGACLHLTCDSQLALFLMQHYEDTKAVLSAGVRCSSCHAALTLTCVTCNPMTSDPYFFTPPCSDAVSTSGAGVSNSVGNNSKDKAVEVCSNNDIGSKDFWKRDADFQVRTEQPPPCTRRKEKRKAQPSSLPPPPSPTLPPPTPPPPPPPPPPPQHHRTRKPREGSPATQQRSPRKRKLTSGNPPPSSPQQTSSPSSHTSNSTAAPPHHQTPGNGRKPTIVKKTSNPQERKPAMASKRPPTSKRPLAAQRLLGQNGRRTEADAPKGVEKNQRRHVCAECGATFSRGGGLKVHMRIHTGERPYRCEECGLSFNQTVSLVVHKRKHSGERPYVCTDCGASFPLASTLKQHGRIHSGERPFSCQHCYKTFSRSGDLTSHLRVHTGVRPFLCQDCGKRFPSSSDLAKHKRTHTDDRPFQCPHCLKRFPFPHRLTAHLRSHTGDRPYLCTVCGAAFARASNLTVHFRIHTGDKPFECEECGKRFSDSGNLCKHRRSSHGEAGRRKKGENSWSGEKSVSGGGSSGVVSSSAVSASVSKGQSCEKLVSNDGSGVAGVSAVSMCNASDTPAAEVASFSVDLPTMSALNHQVLPQTVGLPPLPSSSALEANTSSFVTCTVGQDSRSYDPVHDEKDSLPMKNDPLCEIPSSLASTGQSSLSDFASSFHRGTATLAPRGGNPSPLFEGGGAFGGGSKNFVDSAEGALKQNTAGMAMEGRVDQLKGGALKCEDCPAGFSDTGGVARHRQEDQVSIMLSTGGGTDHQEDDPRSLHARLPGAEEEEPASLLPYFSTAAFSFYYQQ